MIWGSCGGSCSTGGKATLPASSTTSVTTGERVWVGGWVGNVHVVGGLGDLMAAAGGRV